MASPVAFKVIVSPLQIVLSVAVKITESAKTVRFNVATLSQPVPP